MKARVERIRCAMASIGLHDRNVVGGMDRRAGGEGDVVERAGGRPLAVQLGEVGCHAAADPSFRKRLARGGIGLLEGRHHRPGRVGLNRHHLLCPEDVDGSRDQARLRAPSGDRAQFGFGIEAAFGDDLQGDWRAVSSPSAR